MPETSGFFFSHSDRSETDDDLALIADVRHALADGYMVHYDSWWKPVHRVVYDAPIFFASRAHRSGGSTDNLRFSGDSCGIGTLNP